VHNSNMNASAFLLASAAPTPDMGERGGQVAESRRREDSVSHRTERVDLEAWIEQDKQIVVEESEK